MKNTATITWIILIVLIISSALVSGMNNTYVSLIILLLSAIKFSGIAFQFMELKKAHVFWKVLIVAFIVCFALGFLIIK